MPSVRRACGRFGLAGKAAPFFALPLCMSLQRKVLELDVRDTCHCQRVGNVAPLRSADHGDAALSARARAARPAG